MQPKPFLKLAALITLALTLGFAKNSAAAEPAKRPNIVVILADDFGYGSLGCYGGKGLKTPNLDRLASQGRRFTQAYAPGSVCSPTRYAMMTGRYYWRTSVKDGQVLPGNGPLHIETNRLTLASLTKGQGYRTAAIGKWHLGLGTATKVDWNAPLTPGPLAVGFDYFFGLAANFGNQPNGYIENEQLLGRIPGELVSLEGEGKEGKTIGLKVQRVADDVMPQLTRKATEWIEQNRQGPFFLYFTPNAVHEPVTPATQFSGSPYGKYGDFIQELDWSVGRIMETLEKLKLTDNTLVIFTSDNGGVAQEQNSNAGAAMKAGLKINGALRGGKHSIWEGGFREPFIVRWPGKVPVGTVCHDIVSLSDVLATMAGILKTPLPAKNAEDSLDVGTSWFGTAKDKPARDYIVMQDAAANYAIRQGPWKLIERENPPTFKSRNEKSVKKMAHSRKTESPHDELFNLEEDPAETKDVAAKHPNIAQRLRKLLVKTRDQGFSSP
jgi:arylsulfatase A